MRALVTGATGFIGKRLVAALEKPIVLSRDAEAAARALSVEAHAWDPLAGPPPAAALDGVDAVFHLAGETVGGRWNERKKRAIHDSRVVGTRHLVDGIASAQARPRVLVSASAVGFYGDRGDEILDESALPGDDFLAHVCRDWEEESARAKELGVRVVNPRIGIVLGPSGGPLERMVKPFKLGLGGRLGSGRQWMPWIHIDDVVGLLLHAAKNEIGGAMNTVAPHPARNVDFTRALAATVGKRAFLPAPGFALRLALGEFAGAVLGSARVVPRVAGDSGYRFRFPDLDGALRDCLAPADAARTVHSQK